MAFGNFVSPSGKKAHNLCMRKVRIIPRLDIKGPHLIKGVHLEGLRIVGTPSTFAQQYYQDGADELLYIDSVASLYERNNILDMVKETANDIFIPLSVGGGIRSVIDAQHALRSGADKVAINTAAIKNPELITEISEHFGTQCVVLSIEAKKTKPNHWECYIDNGREPTGINVLDWVVKAEAYGAGEILLTSIDQEGTQEGFDLALVKAVMNVAKIPVIASGGMGNLEHLRELLVETQVDAVAIAHVLHFNLLSLSTIHQELAKLGFEVRS